MSDEFEATARLEATRILQEYRAKRMGLGLSLRFSAWSFIQGALWAKDYFKAKELSHAQVECDWDLAQDAVIMPPNKRD